MHNNPLSLPKHGMVYSQNIPIHTLYTNGEANTRGYFRRLDFWLVFFYYMFSLAGGEGRPPGQNGQNF